MGNGKGFYPSAATGGGGGTMIGEITMYYGDISGFPTTTHALCDGTNGTPDLRGQFIRGWSDATGQEYSGSPVRRNNTQTALTARPVSNLTTNSDDHTHGYTDYANADYIIQGNTAGSSHFANFSSAPTARTTGSDSHNHSVTGGGDIETRPKNYALAFIMRTSN